MPTWRRPSQALQMGLARRHFAAGSARLAGQQQHCTILHCMPSAGVLAMALYGSLWLAGSTSDSARPHRISTAGESRPTAQAQRNRHPVLLGSAAQTGWRRRAQATREPASQPFGRPATVLSLQSSVAALQVCTEFACATADATLAKGASAGAANQVEGQP